MENNKIKLLEEAYIKLKEYHGNNGYIIQLKNGIYAYKNSNLTEFEAKFILENYNFEPKSINKIVSINENWAKRQQIKYNLSFIPKRIEIGYFMGQTEEKYVFYARFTQKQEKGYLIECNKDNIYTDFLAEDYTNLQIDFERYNRLASTKAKDRIISKGQQEGIKFLLSRKKCILADEPGYGKTTQLIVAALEGNFDSILVICPASIKNNWKKELSYYVKDKDITVIDSFNDKTKGELESFLGYKEGTSGKKRNELIEEAKNEGKWQDNRFVIVNYDILDELYNISPRSKNLSDEILNKSPLLKYIYNRKSLIIIDEAHRLSTNDSIRYKIIQSLIKKGNPDSIYLASGTPVTNNPENLFYVLQLIGHSVTKNKDYYMTRYCGAKKICHPKHREKRDRISISYIHSKKKNNWYDLTDDEKKELQKKIENQCWMMNIPQGATNLDELKERILNIYIRRLKKDIDGMVPKYVHEVFYELTPSQRIEYDRLWDIYEQEKRNDNPNKDLNKELLEGAVYRKYISNITVPYTENIVDKLIKRGEKVVIACCYDDELYTLRDYYGDKCVVYNGKMSLKQKDTAIEAFYNDSNVMVLIGNIAAAGVGVNMTCARYMVFNNMSYVPGDDRQMEDRIWRRNSDKECHIVYQIFKDTQYEKIWNTVLQKELVINQIVKKESEK